MSGVIPRYGVHRQSRSDTAVDRAVESLGLLGFAVVDAGLGAAEMAELSVAFDRALAKAHRQYGLHALQEIDEHNTIRAPLSFDPAFLGLALNTNVLAVCRLMDVMGFIRREARTSVTNSCGGRSS